ncbi:MAG: ATP-binding cassette domain-containing protein, partial [Paludibacteraceae bacterium]|nr:ATP-binding cassette domain-containing protein [Paludibacteraceae bacterium]
MIEVKNVNKSFDGKQVLFDISANLLEGHANLIIGQSGSGKTVLMKSVAGIHRIDSGEILYDGRNISQMKSNELNLLRREIGMLFQGSALFDSLTVKDNVMFPLRMFSNKSEEEMEERARFCLERVDLLRALDLYPSEISGGMQKRAAIARAIVLNPKYLFCDEPNSGLDPKTSLLIDRLILEITHEYNITTIINTHDMNSVMEIGENIVFISKGHKSWQGNN